MKPDSISNDAFFKEKCIFDARLAGMQPKKNKSV